MATSRSSDPDADPGRREGESGEGSDRAAASRDLAAALIIATFAALAVVFSIRLNVPGSIYTAPGLFPSIIGASLFAMAAVLAWRAVQAGATFGELGAAPRRWAKAVRGTGPTGEAARTAQLMAMVTAYVLLIGLVNFELDVPLGFFTARISSYEVISVIMVTWLLRLFWRAHPARCLIVALGSVEILAAIFRYGFGIPMPAGY